VTEPHAVRAWNVSDKETLVSYYGRVCGALRHLIPFQTVVTALYDSEPVIRRYDEKGRPLRIEICGDLPRLAMRHVVTFHVLTGTDPLRYWILDVDPGDQVSWEEAKTSSLLAYNILKDLGAKPQIVFSGCKGLDVWVRVDGISRDTGRWLTRWLARKVNEEMGTELVTTRIVPKAERRDKVLFDETPCRPKGSVIMPFSVNWHSFEKYGRPLVALPISVGEVETFHPEMATMDEGVKRATQPFYIEVSDLSIPVHVAEHYARYVRCKICGVVLPASVVDMMTHLETEHWAEFIDRVEPMFFEPV